MSSNIKQKIADEKESEEIHLLMHILFLKLFKGYDAKIAREEAKKMKFQ